jgi:hypothetical protein
MDRHAAHQRMVQDHHAALLAGTDRLALDEPDHHDIVEQDRPH